MDELNTNIKGQSKMEKFILFDVGANWGSNSLEVTKNNLNYETYAFEPTPKLYENLVLASQVGSVYPSYRLSDQHHRWPLTPMTDPDGVDYSNRYHAYQLAISNYDGTSIFNLSNQLNCDWGGSSLYEWADNKNYHWGHRPDLEFTDSITVEVSRLDSWFIKNNIQLDRIDHFHCDTQGSDLNVLKGMGDYVHLIQTGVIEVAITSERALYKGADNTLDEAQTWLEARGFIIDSANSQDHEINLSFRKK